MGERSGSRRRRTPPSVHLHDRIANSVIRLGGVAVIAAVLGIAVYLAAVVAPLFMPGSTKLEAAAHTKLDAPLAVLADEYGTTAAVVQRSGRVEVMVLGTGEDLGQVEPEGAVSAVVTTPTGLIAWGFEDGSFQLGEVSSAGKAIAKLPTANPSSSESTDESSDQSTDQSREQAIELGGQRIISGEGPFAGYRSTTQSGNERVTTFALETRAKVTPRNDPGAVTLLDYRKVGGGRELLFTAWADGSARLSTVRVVRPMDGSAPKVRLSGRMVSLEPNTDEHRAHWAIAFGDGESVLTIGRDGSGARYGLAHDAGRRDPLVLMDRVQLAGGHAVRSATALPGGRSVVVGSEDGSLWVWTLSRDPVAPATDQKRLVEVEHLGVGTSPIVSVTAGQRDRTITALAAEGVATQIHLTSRKVIATFDALAQGVSQPVVVGMSPRQDAVVVLAADGHYAQWAVDPGYPGAGWRALFGRVVYEGELRPRWVYQASSAEDAAELKLSLVPLIFGTLKATLVAMLIAAPLSVLAAVYSSEFLHRSVRSKVKPAIELMASLPSVVLGFIAMAVVAPWVGDHLPGVMIGMIVVPGVVLFAAHLWQLFPTRVLLGVPTWARIVLVSLVMVLAGVGSLELGGPVERTFFGPTRSDLLLAAGSFETVPAAEVPAWVGVRETMSPDVERRLRVQGMSFRDGVVVRAVEPTEPIELKRDPSHAALREWLDGLHGRPWPGWALLMLPVFGPLSWWQAAIVRRKIPNARMSRLSVGLSELALFAGSVLFAMGLSVGGALALQSLGLDPRDSFLGTFSQRNTLIVGMVMGFAIIPIIYTISEDALSAVPDTLRSASLGAGATPWQTAWRVVLPVATSGVFSACMIGLGRAAGETMIMLMATGNTPQMDVNIFSGFRTLAANIATELPEAERGGTHYRVLFMCGLVLFIVTFIINTLAEMVRQRYRKKSASL